ncbi:hypothetical protein [Actinacidiphila sp. ITFR-21]|uniref:hypothetical protein n=1 Tax=Actinacidiphila sp. ITFR-21 TaxID=3075199 RepID=UPI00288B4554|nr:hypothetical protein [Streptomyces sp. ITFR-21]WNI18315.1 hypothetical protein RLT57_24110 [Streptomyces sp. ITFR-21]
MLSLRVLRGSRPAALGRWALVAAAAAGTGLLLLSALGWALAHPGHGTADALVRLGWCVVPVVVTVQLAVAVGRTQPAGWPGAGLAGAGLGRTGLVLLTAATTAVVCAAGSALALPAFLQLRGDVTGVPFDGVGPGLLAAGRPLPLAGAVTLLALVPAAAAATVAAGLRARPAAAIEAPRGLPWGIALVAIGLATEVTATEGGALPLPSGLGSIPPGAVGGWIVATAGLMTAGPGLIHACGRVLACYRPGALRLLAGRALQRESHALGRPLGLLCATAAAAVAAYGFQRGGDHPLGPVTVFAAALIAVCVLATAALAFRETRHTRTEATAALRAVAASPALLRAASALRTTALVAALLPATVLVAALSSIPAA